MKVKFINATLGGDYSALDIAITCLATYLNARTPHRATITDLTFRRKAWRGTIKADIDEPNQRSRALFARLGFLPDPRSSNFFVLERARWNALPRAT